MNWDCFVRMNYYKCLGRAGRRGMDDRGYVIVAPRQARMNDARPLKLHRSKTLDWAALD